MASLVSRPTHPRPECSQPRSPSPTGAPFAHADVGNAPCARGSAHPRRTGRALPSAHLVTDAVDREPIPAGRSRLARLPIIVNGTIIGAARGHHSLRKAYGSKAGMNLRYPGYPSSPAGSPTLRYPGYPSSRKLHLRTVRYPGYPSSPTFGPTSGSGAQGGASA